MTRSKSAESRGSDPYLDPYRQAHRQHGSAFGVTLWANQRSQLKRFDLFTQMCFFAGKRILDAGCSRGDFAQYLNDRHIDYGHYVGIDGVAEVIAYAAGRSLPRAEFHAGDFLAQPSLLAIGEPQIIVISGTLNTMRDKDVYATLDAAWAACGESLLFNFLSDRTSREAVEQEHPARRLSTMAILDWAMHKTWAVQFRQDYFTHGHDATVLMKKA